MSATTDHYLRCPVCWLARELQFADDEFGEDWPEDFEFGVDVMLGQHSHLADGDQEFDEAHHESLSAESLAAAADAAQWVANYRRGENNL